MFAMGCLECSSPLSSIPDEPSSSLGGLLPPEVKAKPPKRAIASDIKRTNAPAKRVRRQSKTDRINPQLTPERENPLFHPFTQKNLSPLASTSSTPLPTAARQPHLDLVETEITNPEQSSPSRPRVSKCNVSKAAESPSGLIQSRLFSDFRASRSLPAHLRVYGPLWEPPALTYLVYNKSLRIWEKRSEPMEITPAFRKRMQTAEADLLYAPSMSMLSDSSWYKTKWNLVERRENDRWGGWYDHLKLHIKDLLQSRLNDEDAKGYLPIGVQFPAANTKAASQEPSRIIPNTITNRWALETSQGSLSLFAGPLTVENLDGNKPLVKQENITFQRFASCRLNSLIPDKAGFVFNAGAPVWSMDFLPGANLTNHSQSLDENGHLSAYDFLALSTISHDPGLLPPSEISKRHQDNVKSAVQIWSIPHQEARVFSDFSTNNNRSDESRGPHSAGAPGPSIDPFATDQSAILDHQNESPRLAVLLGFPNQASVVRWCPRGGSKVSNVVGSVDSDPSAPQVDPLGLLAIAFLDGMVGLYSVPHPLHAKKLGRFNQASSHEFQDDRQVLTLNLAPIAKLMLPSTSCLTLEWANHDMLAGGCMNGSIVIWHIETLLQLLTSSPALEEPLLIRPTHLKPIHEAAIRSISWIQTPPIDQFARPVVNDDPPFLASTGYDGSVKMLDLLDLTASTSFLHERGETTSLSFSSVLGCLNMADSDYSIKAISLKPRDLGVSKKLLAQLGLVWQIAASDFHSFIAYAAADGVCGLASAIRPQKYRSRATVWAPKVYQMDFNKRTSQLRMLDNMMPQPRSQDGTAIPDSNAKPKQTSKKVNNLHPTSAPRREKKSQQPAQSVSPIGVYPSIVGVNCLCWNKLLSKGCVLASGMGCGLVRIDYVEGGFNNANNLSRAGLGYNELIALAQQLNNSGGTVDDDPDD